MTKLEIAEDNNIQLSATRKLIRDTGLELGVEGRTGFRMAKVFRMYYGKGNTDDP